MIDSHLNSAKIEAISCFNDLISQDKENIDDTHPIHPLFSNRRPKFLSTTTSTSLSNHRTIIVNADITNKSNPTTTSFTDSEDQSISVVGQENVPLEGVIQFEKPDTSSRFRKWSHVALLSGGDVLAILLFSIIGRFSHGFPAFDGETLNTADPFIAGWFLSAYFLGGYGEDGQGVNGKSNAITVAVKSWALGVPEENLETTGRGLTSKNDYFAENLMRDHELFLNTLQSRLTKLQVVQHFWKGNDTKGAVWCLYRYWTDTKKDQTHNKETHGLRDDIDVNTLHQLQLSAFISIATSLRNDVTQGSNVQ